MDYYLFSALLSTSNVTSTVRSQSRFQSLQKKYFNCYWRKERLWNYYRCIHFICIPRFYCSDCEIEIKMGCIYRTFIFFLMQTRHAWMTYRLSGTVITDLGFNNSLECFVSYCTTCNTGAYCCRHCFKLSMLILVEFLSERSISK